MYYCLPNRRIHWLSIIVISSALLSCNTETPVTKKRTSNSPANNCPGILQELRNPPIKVSTPSELKTTLVAKKVDKCINGKVLSLMSYIDTYNSTKDSRPVGPAYILKFNKNQQQWPVLKIELKNELVSRSGQQSNNCNHGGAGIVSCTNLHTHGLHVSPKQGSDNVFEEISPGGSSNYTFNIPSYHAPGTHWIHPHLHGSTAPQIKEGMAAALILKGETDDWLAREYGIKNEKDKIMLLQQLEQLKNKVIKPLCGGDDNEEKLTTSINGQCLPIITVSGGNVHHWRLIHAGISATINFAIETTDGKSIQILEYARDGINLGQAFKQKSVVLQPGYRSDILLKMPMLGADICPYPQSRQGVCELLVLDKKISGSRGARGTAEKKEVIAKIRINRNGQNMTMPPEKNVHWAKPYSEIKDSELINQEQEIWFASNNGKHTVNDFSYPNGSKIHLKLDDAQTWRLWVDNKTQKPGEPNHPFHIHINPFEVIIRNPESGKIIDRYWKDTLLVSASDNYEKAKALEIRMRYEKFKGKFVLHCHNLNHEDAGMMKDVEIF